jgi:hypothetical protein
VSYGVSQSLPRRSGEARHRDRRPGLAERRRLWQMLDGQPS